MPLPPAADGSFWRSTRSLPDPPPRCVCWKSFVSGAERGGSRRRLDRVEGLTQSASRSNRLSAILLNRAYSSASCRDDIGCITCCLKSPTEKRFRRRDDSGPETLSIPRGSQSPAVSAKSATERHRATPSDTERHRAPQLGMNQRTVQLPRFCSKPLRFFLSNSPMSACAASQRPSTAPEFARAPTVPECRNKSVHLVNPYPRCQSVNGLTHHQASHRHRKEPADSADFIPSESASWRSTIHDDHRRPSLTGARRFT